MNSVASPPLSPRRRFLVRACLLLLAGLGLAAGFVVVALIPPTPTSFYPKCLSYQVTGTHCPGCGTTRALHALLNGQLTQAVSYNLFALIALPYVLFSTCRSAWYWAWGEHARSIVFPPKVMWSFVAFVILFWILRNVPVYPFTLLAPHELAP